MATLAIITGTLTTMGTAMRQARYPSTVSGVTCSAVSVRSSRWSSSRKRGEVEPVALAEPSIEDRDAPPEQESEDDRHADQPPQHALSRATLLTSMGPSARITAAAVGISGSPRGRR